MKIFQVINELMKDTILSDDDIEKALIMLNKIIEQWKVIPQD